MIQIRSGSTTKPAASEQLKEAVSELCGNIDGILYIGYPVFFVAGESVALDALLVSPDIGVVVFDIVEEPTLENRCEVRDEIYGKMQSQLVAVPELNKRRELSVPISVATFCPAYRGNIDQDETYASKELLSDFINNIKRWESNETYNILLSQVQSILKIRASKTRNYIKGKNTKGAILKDFEATIANLDSKQEEAVIESVNGIQRIRGLAGSGKTIILALKAAYFHAKNPEWTIGVTFHTRSLKQQFKNLIKRFCIEKTGREPNWKKLIILNAWGSDSNPGVYSEACRIHGTEYFNFGQLKSQTDPFEYANHHFLNNTKEIEENFDALLIDEAQDLPVSFLKLCHRLLRPPKRLVYAYDEMQKLNQGAALPSPQEIFGESAEDVILKCCYRNPRPLLVSAHAVGFGIYRESMVQFFNQPGLWADVGYELEEGRLAAGERATLFRPENTSPGFFENRVNFNDLISVRDFNSEKEQADWITKDIIRNIEQEELLPSDILVINPEAFSTKSATSIIRRALIDHGINSHIAGEMNADIFTKDDSVAFSGIYRAKGNEAAMVYLINADNCYESHNRSPSNLITKRNTLFTAITRSKAWVNICGTGPRMKGLKAELDHVKENNYKLSFTYPTDEEIERMNVIHRDITREQRKTIEESTNIVGKLKTIRDSINNGETFIEDYPQEVVELLQQIFD